MAIITRLNEKGSPVFESARGLEISIEETRKAIQLDELIKDQMIGLKERLISEKIIKQKASKDKVEAYWEFGFVMRKIFESGLVCPSEKKLFWRGIELHAPKELMAKNRGPNRIHVAYCFRLAGYLKKLVLKRKWGEWVYFFDSHREERFDKWDERKMLEEPENMARKNMRLFFQCLNNMLKNVETSELNDKELDNCYDGGWELSKKMFKENLKDDQIERAMQSLIEKRNIIGKLMEDSISSSEFAEEILNGI